MHRKKVNIATKNTFSNGFINQCMKIKKLPASSQNLENVEFHFLITAHIHM